MSTFVPFSKIPDFNPREVPIHSWDTHLPAVPASELSLPALQARFMQPPLWQPEVREEPRFTDRAPRNAAVLIALVMRDEPTLILTQRAEQMSNHAGQIAFPGGKLDAGETVQQAALREASEEIGLASDFVHIIGTLPRYTTGTAFHITPVVAAVRPGFTLKAHPGEVASVFEVPLVFLMNPANHARHRFEFQGHQREWFSMPWSDAQAARPDASPPQTRFIWGATAGMLRNLYRFLAA